MPFSKSRFVPVAFWVGFLALGLATNVSHEQKIRNVARGKQETSLVGASGKRMIAPLAGNHNQTIARD
ncbi:MAG: hypothetical protein AB7F41_15645 [Methylocystis sp.]|uniref:hypothetical protein n=1 Tax=Methylocystis sp. TaxID=1911079 RepID=UPI003D0AC817